MGWIGRTAHDSSTRRLRLGAIAIPMIVLAQIAIFPVSKVGAVDVGRASLQHQPMPDRIMVPAAPDVRVTQTTDASPVSAGTAIGFTVTISNPGAGNATGVTLTDPLPSGTGVSWSIDPSIGDPAAFALTGAAGSQQLALAGQPISLAAGAGLAVHITSATAFASCADYLNIATVNVGNETGGPFRAIAGTTVECPTLSITKTADATTVSHGTPIGFKITVSSGGPGTATSVMVDDPLPAGAGLGWSIASQTASACSITGSAPTQTLRCPLGDMTLLTSYKVHVASPTTSDSAGTYRNTATASADNSPSVHATATIVVQGPGLAITTRADAASVASGGAVGFTVTVSNGAAPGIVVATNVSLTDPLPAGTGIDWAISSASSGSGPCSIATGSGSQVLTCSFGDMAPGATASVHVTSSTTANATCGTLNDTATVSAGNAPTLQSTATVAVGCSGVQAITTPIATPMTGWSNMLWAAIALMATGLVLLLFGTLGRRRRTALED